MDENTADGLLPTANRKARVTMWSMSQLWRGLRGKELDNVTAQSEQFLLEYIKNPKYVHAWQTYFLSDTRIKKNGLSGQLEQWNHAFESRVATRLTSSAGLHLAEPDPPSKETTEC